MVGKVTRTDMCVKWRVRVFLLGVFLDKTMLSKYSIIYIAGDAYLLMLLGMIIHYDFVV